MKIIKRMLLVLLVLVLFAVGYVYALTFKAGGRMDWGQALFLKLAGDNDQQTGLLKTMTVQQRSHFTDAVPIDTKGLQIDTLAITGDSLKTYIFKPGQVKKSSPTIVYYHGGAFVLPWNNVSVTYAALLCRSFDAIVVGVDYRVAPEHPFPIPNNDCYAALQWTLQNIHAWGGDPNQIIVAGESAGATLAATVAIKAARAQMPQIKYQILDCPVAYVPFETEAYKKFKRGYFLEETEMVFGVQSYLPNKADYIDPLAMPFYEENLLSLPQAYVITCEFDPLSDTGRDYAKKLKRSNIPTVHKEMKGMLHCMPGPFNQNDRTGLYREIARQYKQSRELSSPTKFKTGRQVKKVYI